MPAAQKKDILDQIISTRKCLAEDDAKSPPAASKPKVFEVLPEWELSGTADDCIVCGAPSSTLLASQFDKMCPGPCFHYYVKSTASKGEEPHGKLLTCESCMVEFKPNTLFWGRSIGKSRAYDHVNFSECIPISCAKGKCGRCGASVDSRFNLNPIGSDNSAKKVCEPCFVKTRRTNLVGCQPEAVKKRAQKQAKYQTSNKKSKH